MAPKNFQTATIASVGSIQISEQVLRNKFKEHFDEDHVSVIVELLQHFDLCYRLKHNNTVFEFPAFIQTPLDLNKWKPEPNFKLYCGRHLVCTEETDSFPPGFFSRLQVSMSEVLDAEKVLHHFKSNFIVDARCYQCLVQMNTSSTCIALTGRSEGGCVQDCMQLLDTVQTQVGKLVRNVCPTIFLKLMIPSTVDLKNHVQQPFCYSIHELTAGGPGVRIAAGTKESVTDLLYMGDEEYRKANEGVQTKVAYIPLATILQVQELLSDGDIVSALREVATYNMQCHF